MFALGGSFVNANCVLHRMRFKTERFLRGGGLRAQWDAARAYDRHACYVMLLVISGLSFSLLQCSILACPDGPLF